MLIFKREAHANTGFVYIRPPNYALCAPLSLNPKYIEGKWRELHKTGNAITST